MIIQDFFLSYKIAFGTNLAQFGPKKFNISVRKVLEIALKRYLKNVLK